MAKQRASVRQDRIGAAHRVVNVQIKSKARDPTTNTLEYEGSRALTVENMDMDRVFEIVRKALTNAN
jgi:hypothetical protein